MWWIIILALVAFVIFKFAVDVNKQAGAVIKQGGMRKKYSILIDYLLNANQGTRIFTETSTFITLGITGLGGSTIFNIQQTFGTVSIEWKAENHAFGKHSLKWNFNEFLDQKKMIEKIENDLGIYQSNLMQRFM